MTDRQRVARPVGAPARRPGGPVAVRDALLAGMPSAQELARSVLAAPGDPLVCSVAGPGGSGKSALLAVLARIAENAGVPVRWQDDDPSGRDGLLLVDDAQDLGPDALDRLAESARDPAARIVVAYRAWPTGPELSRLAGVLARGGRSVALGRVERAGTASRAAAVLGAVPPPLLLAMIDEETAGVPALVDRLCVAVRDAGGPEQFTGDPPRLSAAVTERFRHDLDRVPRSASALLVALALGAPPDPQLVGPALGLPVEELDDAFDAARSTGFLLDDDTVVPFAGRSVLALTPAGTRRRLGQLLAETAHAHGAPLVELVRPLLGAGLRGEATVTVLEAAGDEALAESPELAGRFLAEAVTAGAPPARLAARRAEVATLAGDFDAALRLADRVVAEAATADHDRAVTAMASVLAHRGMPASSADLLVHGPSPALAVPALVGTGAVEEARSALERPRGPGAVPTAMLGSAATLTARGILDTVDGTPTAALSQLTRAASLLEPVGQVAVLPDTPSALAALVAMHTGELAVADSVLARAVSAGLGGRPFAARHRLLRAWVAMLRGDIGPARELARVGDAELEPRDELVAAALDVGIARRLVDVPALRAAWGRAREAIVRYPVDLFVLQPLGEFAVAAARMRDDGWILPYWREAEALTERLGRPPLWTVSMHWYGLGAALTAERDPDADRHVAALEDMAPTSTFAATTATAARVWRGIPAGRIDADEVEAAARALSAHGWSWDGARLAGEAAIRTVDRRAMGSLLACARSLQGADGPGEASGPVAPGWPGAATGEVALSEREREVAVLVLAGLTHRQIGDRLFISSKTVEHHVARIRQRLGSRNRVELFARLRVVLGDPAG